METKMVAIWLVILTVGMGVVGGAIATSEFLSRPPISIFGERYRMTTENSQGDIFLVDTQKGCVWQMSRDVKTGNIWFSLRNVEAVAEVWNQRTGLPSEVARRRCES